MPYQRFSLIACTLIVSAAAAPAAPESPVTQPSAATQPAATTQPAVRRVGGDLAAQTNRDADEYASGDCRVTTPLPDGYPPPTPPLALELKHYPSVRRAEFSGEIAPDLGMNVGFFPLFQHIKARRIAMTSPVEMDYSGMMLDPAQRQRKGWTMSFLYRNPSLGPTGADGAIEGVRIVDTKPLTVVALGMRGPYGVARVEAALTQIEAWLQGQSDWDAAGPARALYYNGPDTPGPRLWWEVQVPVQPTATR